MAAKGPKLTYTHDAMVDLILQEPTVTTEELAELFGLSKGWISRVVASDTFKARLAQRKAQLIDPLIAQSLNERVASVTIRSLDVIATKLDTDGDAAFAVDALSVASKVAFNV